MERTTVTTDTSVVVVGGGLAGLAAADRLVGNGVDCVVLEARDRVGGRVHSEPWLGTWVDQGGQWLGPGQDHVYDLAARLGLPTTPSNVTGDKLLHFDGRPTRYRGRVPRLPPLALADVAQAQWRFDRLAAAVDLRHPWRTPNAETLDGQTFETWIRRTVRTRGGREFFRVAAQGVFATEAANLSLLHVLFYSRSGTDFETLLTTAGGAQQDRLVGGTQQLAQGLHRILGDRVRLGRAVTRLHQDEHGVSVTAGADTVTAAYAIVAVPPALAAGIEFHPALPPDRAQLQQRMPHGSVIKFHAAYERPFWRDDGLCGEVAGDRGLVKVIFDNSPPEGTPGILVGFFEGMDAVAAGRYPQEVRREVVRTELVRYLGPQAADLIAYTDTDWSAEPYTRGCYGAHLPPGAWTQFGTALRPPVGRVHWAGTETAERWAGYMDGALSSGIRAADEVLVGIPR